MPKKEKYFSVIPHAITRCGKRLTDAQYRVLMVLLSWTNRKTGICKYHLATLAYGQRDQKDLGYEDRGCARNERNLRDILDELERIGIITVTYRSNSSAVKSELQVDFSWFSKRDGRSLSAERPVPFGTGGRSLSAQMAGPFRHRELPKGTDEKKPEKKPREETNTQKLPNTREEREQQLNETIEELGIEISDTPTTPKTEIDLIIDRLFSLWETAGLNGLKSKERVKAQIINAVIALNDRHGDKLDELFATAITNRAGHGGRPFKLDNPSCHSLEWLFQPKQEGGESVYNIEKCASGAFNWTDKKINPNAGMGPVKLRGGW